MQYNTGPWRVEEFVIDKIPTYRICFYNRAYIFFLPIESQYGKVISSNILKARDCNRVLFRALGEDLKKQPEKELTQALLAILEASRDQGKEEKRQEIARAIGGY